MAQAPEQRGSATIYSVADRAGVSIATVSRVVQGTTAVSERTRTKVLDAVRELGYVPSGAARQLAVRQHEAHGLVLPELSGPYYAELLMGFETRAAELGQSVVVLLAEGKADVTRAVRQLASRVDGLAFLGSPAIPDSAVTEFQSSKPVVLVSGHGHEGVDTISTENLTSATELTAHLIEHGRSRLVFVGDPDAGPDIRDRYAGFAAAHAAAGLGAVAEPVRVELRESGGVAAADLLLAREIDADALVCANDEIALAVMARLHDHGRDIPSDVAVVGWDDVMTARYVRPGLTTVRQPVRALGALAADLLHQRCTGATPRTEPTTLATQVVLRESCGCPAPQPRRHG